jgi:hypothetical protein
MHDAPALPTCPVTGSTAQIENVEFATCMFVARNITIIKIVESFFIRLYLNIY